MAYILYDRFFYTNKENNALNTYWRVIGKSNKYPVVKLHESKPVPTLNCFNSRLASLYIFCKPTQCLEFERKLLMDLHKGHGNNLKIFKYTKQLTVVNTSHTLLKNLDNIQNVFAMHTCTSSNIDVLSAKEPISRRHVYKICFKDDKNLCDKILQNVKFFNLTQYPNVETFVPFDDECELLLNFIFPTTNLHDNYKHTYMTIVPCHNIDYIHLIESLHGIIQLVNCRNISNNIMVVNNRESIKNSRAITDLFLENVPVIDICIGRVYEDEQCVEFTSNENEITFIMIKMYIMKSTQYIVFLNSKYQILPLKKRHKLNNFISCDSERDMLLKFFNMYTSGLMFKILNVDTHFIISSQRYKSSSYIMMYRIIYNNCWNRFMKHCVVSEDGKCIRFNKNTIILFDNIDKCDDVITNIQYIEKNCVYLPELYNDSIVNIASSLDNHLKNIRTEKNPKYINITRNLEKNRQVNTMSLYEMIEKIFEEEEKITSQTYTNILESIIDLANKIRIPITLLYSLSVAQISYRLIFYDNLRRGVFLLMDRDDKNPQFYQSNNIDHIQSCIRNLSMPRDLKVFKNLYINGGNDDTQNRHMFELLIKKYISEQMTGNFVENYFAFFCPSTRHFPIISSIVDNEMEILSFKNAITWSRQHLYSNKSIVSFDFSLYNSSIISLFGIDFNNCMILYGFELKNFFFNIYPTREEFTLYGIKLLQLPHTFIMDNDSLEIINIINYDSISSHLNDTSCYIVIMRFITSAIMQKQHARYEPLSELFYSNIVNMKKYKTRLTLHKNILNAIYGMLSSYQINTTILNIINALSRKIILWVVFNCLQSDYKTSFIEHKYNVGVVPPDCLISIENDSFTFIYDYRSLRYDKCVENANTVEMLRKRILDELSSELTSCTKFTQSEVLDVINLKVNFNTGNLYQISSRRFFYLTNDGNGKPYLVSNEKNNKSMQKSLKYLNHDKSLLKTLRRNETIQLSYLKRTFNFTETRRLLLWYIMQHSCHHHSNTSPINNQIQIFKSKQELNDFIRADDKYDSRDVELKTNLLFTLVTYHKIDDYFISLLSNSMFNLNFQHKSVPEDNAFKNLQLPNDKKKLIIETIQLFFKLYRKFTLVQ